MAKKVREARLQVVELRADGLPYKEIADRLGIDVQEAIDTAKENTDRIATLRAVKMEAIFEEGRVTTQGRIEQLSDLRARLKAELDRRNLADLPTKDLIALYLKTTDSLKAEVYTPTIQSTQEQEQDKLNRSSFGGW